MVSHSATGRTDLMLPAEILFVPSLERVRTTNAWALLHWLSVQQAVEITDWQALQRWSIAEPAAFRAAIVDFAGLEQDAGPARVRQAASVLLHLDVRPDDRVLITGEADSLTAAMPVRTAVLRYWGAPEALLQAAGEQAASVVIAPATVLARATFRCTGPREPLARLRQIVALGDKLAPALRTRIYTWVKQDVMLLALAGDMVWGDPLSPVLRAPPPQPALGASLRRLASAGPGAR